MSIGIYLSTILQEILQPSITRISWKIIFLKFLWNLPGANELMYHLCRHRSKHKYPKIDFISFIHFFLVTLIFWINIATTKQQHNNWTYQQELICLCYLETIKFTIGWWKITHDRAVWGLGGKLLICQNTTMRVYGAWIRIYHVLC